MADDEEDFDEEREDDLSADDDARDYSDRRGVGRPEPKRSSYSSRDREENADDEPASREESRDAVDAARKARKVFDSARDGDMNPYKAKALLDEGQAALDDLKAKGGKLDAQSAIKMAKTHTSGVTQKALEHAETLSKDGVNVGSLASIAAAGDLGLPMNEHVAAFAKAVDAEKKSGKPDFERIQKLPGTVVDPKTGDVSLFGLVPIPVQYASMLSIGYSLGIGLINRSVFGYAFKGGSALATKLGAVETISPIVAGKIAGYSAIAFTTHWPDFSIFLQSERDFKKKINEVCTEIAPVLDTLKGHHGASALYSVTKEENEILYNERQRINIKHNAERYRNAMQATGRSAQFIASAMDGREIVHGLENTTGALKKAGNASENIKAHYAELAQHAKDIEKHSGGLIKGDKAIEEAKNLMSGVPTSKPKSKDAVWENSWSDWRNAGALAFTVLMQGVGHAVFDKKTAGLPEVSAYRMILTLRKYIDEDSKASAYPLPDKMRVEGVKGSASNDLPLTEYIFNIFQKHEQDCANDAEAKIPSRLQQKLLKASELIAKDLHDGKLDALALIDLVGERKIVRNNGKSVADEKVVRRELEEVRGRMRHTEWVDGDKYIAESSFSKEELKRVWDKLNEEERNIFVSLVPPQALEAAGVKADDVRHRRQAREKQFDEDMTKVLKGAVALGDKALQDQNITEKEIALLHEAHNITEEQGAKGIFNVLPGAGHHINVAQPLTEVVVKYVAQGGRVNDLIQRGAEV